MRMRLRGRLAALIAGGLLAFQWSLTAQTPSSARPSSATPSSATPSSATQSSAKRPLSYDVVDSWRSIQGTKLSNDGQWLAYALRAQGDDGELIVRNLRTNQEFKHGRGTSPFFTADGKFVVFTIVPTKAEDERVAQEESQSGEGQANQTGGGRGARSGQASGQAGGRGNQAARTPRSSLGIMTLPAGQVTTVEKVGSFLLPEESSTWLAYYKGNGGTGSGGGRGGRGGGAGRGAGAGAGARQGGPPATAAPEEPQGRGQTASREKRKDPGSDLILRNLTTGQETTVPEVTEYEWDKKGTWLAYTTSSNDAARDGAFVHQTTDGAVRALLTGRGHYKSLAFDEAGQQLAFLSDQAEYDRPVSPYRLYLWEAADATAAELVAASTPSMPKGMVVSDNGAPSFSKDGARVFLATAPALPAPPDPNAKTPAPIQVDLWSWKDPMIQPMQKVRAEQERTRSYRAVVHLADKKFVQLATPDLPNVTPPDDLARALARIIREGADFGRDTNASAW